MGGRVAEELILGSKTSGASNDLERASEIARKMVCTWGMSDKMGPLKWGNEHDQIFLGKEFGTVKNYSEETARAIDDEIKNIVMSCYSESKDLITKNKDKLVRISDALLEREVLSAEEIDMLIEDKILPPKVEYKKPGDNQEVKKEEVKTDAGLSHQTA